MRPCFLPIVVFFNDTSTTEIYTLSLHDALPSLPYTFEITVQRKSEDRWPVVVQQVAPGAELPVRREGTLALERDELADRKSTRLNSSHANISYAVFCLKKKNNKNSCA